MRLSPVTVTVVPADTARAWIGLAHWAVAASFRSSALAAERGRPAIELARRHGWSGEPAVAIAYLMLAGSLVWQGELAEAERWLAEGEDALQSEVDAGDRNAVPAGPGFLEIARGHLQAALATLRAAERLPGQLLSAAHPLTTQVHAFLLHVLGAAGGDRASRCRPDRDGRTRTPKARYPHRRGRAAARPGQPASSDRRARARPR